MLSSADLEILNAHKYENIKICCPILWGSYFKGKNWEAEKVLLSLKVYPFAMNRNDTDRALDKRVYFMIFWDNFC